MTPLHAPLCVPECSCGEEYGRVTFSQSRIRSMSDMNFQSTGFRATAPGAWYDNLSRGLFGGAKKYAARIVMRSGQEVS
jgi:hypothetical protein